MSVTVVSYNVICYKNNLHLWSKEMSVYLEIEDNFYKRKSNLDLYFVEV